MNNITYISLAFFIAATLAMLIIPKVLVIAKKHSLYDSCDERKIHDGNIPRIGGVSFTPCIIFATMFVAGIFDLFADNTDKSRFLPGDAEFYLFFCGLILLYLGGVKDDLVGLRYIYKFAIQIFASSLIVLSGLYINNLYGFWGIHEIPFWIGEPLTILVLVFIINAINLIDGLDGLASGLSIFALSIYGIIFILNDAWFYAVIAFSSLGVLIPFFYYNVFGSIKKGQKIFMGDSGSLTLGLIMGFLILRLINYDPEVIKMKEDILVIAVSPILIPMLDVIRVVYVRIRNKKNIFIADRSHIHHKMMKIGINKSTALLFLLLINAGFCLMNFLLIYKLDSLYIFLIDMMLWTMINIYLSSIVKKEMTRKNSIP